MQLTNDEKRVLNGIFNEVKGTTRNTMLMAVYAAKPADDGTPDAKAMITLLNGLIIKLSQADRDEMEALFAGIPYSVE
ncbi:hypothetical protein [Acetobacterium bakii]|uniref:Uncharacterized protein n=1 Tax=Acetobacterium bakii TaxID=52689 RepID=A0A0L6TW84_9FIRM|nr:hypothetical protein [Acetobacterium bakii]KNZ40529.1 hypothetical protein AKG39_17125 [Acetobacterium bakii]